MTKEKLIEFLRHNLVIQDNSVDDESDYLKMSDEQIELYLTIALNSQFPHIPRLELLPEKDLKVLLLVARKELYYSLASKFANEFDIGADNNNYLKRSQKFNHYLKLAENVSSELDDIINGIDIGQGINTLAHKDVLLSKKFNTFRNYEKGGKPVLLLNVDKVYINSVEISYNYYVSNSLNSIKVFISENPILDEYVIGNKIKSGANLVITITNPKEDKIRIENLKEDTTYYIAFAVRDVSGNSDYKQVMIKTLDS